MREMSAFHEIPPVKEVKLGIIGMRQVFLFGYRKWFNEYLKRGSLKLTVFAEKNRNYRKNTLNTTIVRDMMMA